MYTVGQEVAVIRHGSWGHIQSQGKYKITKSNKARVHLQRISDGYERIFSAVTGIEKGSQRYYTAEIISTERYDQIQMKSERERTIRESWQAIQTLASNRDLNGLKEAIANLEKI